MISADVWRRAQNLAVSPPSVEGSILWAEVRSGTSENVYTPWVRRDGVYGCGCTHFTYHDGPCSHLAALVQQVGREALAELLLHTRIEKVTKPCQPQSTDTPQPA